MLKFLFLLTISLSLFANDVLNSKILAEGGKLYTEACIICHGAKGDSITNEKFVVKPRKLTHSILSMPQMVSIISEGGYAFGANSHEMPAFKFMYNKKEIVSIAKYVTEKFNSKRDVKIEKLLKNSKKYEVNDEIVLQLGKNIFDKTCSKCHGLVGNAKSSYVKYSTKNQKFIYPYDLTKLLLTKTQIFLYAKYGGLFWGTDRDSMPSWKNKYTDEELKAVASYVNILSKR